MTPKTPRTIIIRILCAIYEYCGTSTHCHVASEKIARLLPRYQRGYVKSALRQLIREGLVYEKHHGKGRRSYGLTEKGAEHVKKLCLLEDT